MYSKESSYRIVITDRESSLIRANIETYIRNKKWDGFFRSAYCCNEMIDLLTILRKVTDNEVVVLDKYEIRLIVDACSSADKTLGSRLELIQLKDDLDKLIA